MHIANIARDVFNFQVKIKTSFFTYIKLKYKYFPWLKRTKTNEIDIEQFIQFIEDANNEKGIFAKIKAIIPLIVPLIVQTIKKSESLADAITMRCFK